MNIPQITQMPVINSNHKSTTNTLTTLPRKGTQGSSHQGPTTTTLTTQASPIARRSSGTDDSKRVFKPVTSPGDQRTVSSPKQVFCSYHKTKTHNLDECQKFRDLDFEERKEFLFKNRFCFNCANSNKHIGRNCDQGPPQCKICGNRHATLLHDPSRSENKVTSASSACTQVCKEGPIRSCARIVLLKVSSQSDPSKETLTFAVLDDQSTDVFVTDNLLNELSIDGKEVNLQVNTIVGTNTVRTRKVCGLQVQDVNGEYSPVKVCYAYAQESIQATHHDIATPEIARQWEHLKTIADKIPYRPDIEIDMLIGRNIPSAFQPLNVIHGTANEPWAEEYKFGWTIIGPVCLADAETKECNLIVSVNRITVHREELPFHDPDRDLLQPSQVVAQNGSVTLLTSIK